MNLIVLFQIILVFILPIFLLYFNIIPVKYRDAVLVTFSLIILVIIIKGHWTLKSLGIRTDNLLSSIIPYAVFTLIGLIVIFILAKSFHRTHADKWWSKENYFFIPVLLTIFQEFAFRSFLMPQLESIFSSIIIIILINALLFSFLHIMFPNPLLLLPIGFLAGIGFAFMYYFYPNLILISISHAILTVFAVSYSFFSFPS